MARWRHVLVSVALLSASLGVAGDSGPPPDPDAPGLSVQERFDALFERVRQEEGRLQTLEASFLQRSESPLLLAPEEVRGTFSYRAPDRIRWDFGAPKSLTVIVRGRESFTWYHDLRRVERRDLGRQEDRMLELVGASPSLERLQRYFSLRATFPKAEGEPYVLELLPLSGRIEKRIRSMTLKIDRKLFVPVFLRYVGAEDATTEMTFEDVRLNGEIPEERFTPVFPEDVTFD